MISDFELANEIIRRLNDLISNSDICEDVQNLIEHRIQCSEATMSHELIQTYDDMLGFLGLLNGIIGTCKYGKHVGWGYITAIYNNNNNKLTHFKITPQENQEVINNGQSFNRW